jgi:hypothetical protein
MTATDKIRALMADGRARTSREVAHAVGSVTPRHAGQLLRFAAKHGEFLRFPLPRSQSPIWRINPNFPAVITAGRNKGAEV